MFFAALSPATHSAYVYPRRKQRVHDIVRKQRVDDIVRKQRVHDIVRKPWIGIIWITDWPY